MPRQLNYLVSSFKHLLLSAALTAANLVGLTDKSCKDGHLGGCYFKGIILYTFSGDSKNGLSAEQIDQVSKGNSCNGANLDDFYLSFFIYFVFFFIFILIL